MLNIMKAVYTVSAAVPYPGSFWTPGLRLIVLWKVGLDSIMVSGLGELVSCTLVAANVVWCCLDTCL